MIHRLRTLAACCVLGLAAGAAVAQPLRDAQWNAWLDAGRHAELEQAAQARIAQQGIDADGAVALALSATALGGGARLDAATQAAQQCVDRLPQQAGCHYALGMMLGVQASRGGALGAMRLARRIRDALERSVALDPQLFAARSTLQQYYLEAPSIAGGNVGRARELAAEVAATQPQQARLLRARLAAHEHRWDEARAELSAVQPGPDRALRDAWREGWAGFGLALLKERLHDEAGQAFETLSRLFPAHAEGPYGLARVALAREKPEEAAALLERARAMAGARDLPIDLRLGQALLALGDRPRAREAYQRFVDEAREGRTNPRHLDEARKRLAEIG